MASLQSSGTMSGYTVNGNALFRLFYTRYVGQTVTNIAHLALWAEASAANIPAIDDVVAAAFGYVGETAGDHMDRVAEARRVADHDRRRQRDHDSDGNSVRRTDALADPRC